MSSRIPALAIACLLVLASCGNDGGGGEAEPTKVVVYTDVALESVVGALESALESTRPDINVEIITGLSTDLRSKIEDGDESADIIIATSSEVDVLRAQELLADDALVFGSDALVITVPKGNPGHVDGISDFESDAAARTGVCEPATVCGIPAAIALERAGIVDGPDLVTDNAVDLLLDLVRERLDAGLLLRSQAATQGDAVSTIELPDELATRTDLSIAPLHDSPVISDTVDWMATSAEAGEILRSAGFRELPQGPN